MIVRDILHAACAQLTKAGVDTPEIDSGLLLGHCLGKSRTALYLMAQEEIDLNEIDLFFSFLARRVQREPLAYILGVQEFWSLDFIVTPDVLIPRPETELLIERGIAIRKEHSSSKGIILDLCTGSGIIAIVLAKELNEPVVAVDLSFAALRIARENAKFHGVDHLISFVQSDLLSAIIPEPCFSLVLSNPPYVSSQEQEHGLQPEVYNHEPHLALFAGDKGLEVIEKIHDQLLPRFLPEAHLLMEIGYEQRDDIVKLFSAKGTNDKIFTELRVEKDYSNCDRIFQAKIIENS